MSCENHSFCKIKVINGKIDAKSFNKFFMKLRVIFIFHEKRLD